MSVRHELARLLKDLDAADAAANDLWTWLPSYAACKKKHGDHVDAYRPPNDTIMSEAASFFAVTLKGREPDVDEKLLFQCPCGEHEEVPAPVEHPRAGEAP